MASGSCTYLKDWLNQKTKDQTPMGTGAVKICCDNEQVIGKRYNVRAGGSCVPMSVITSHAYITIGKNSEIQNDTSLKPNNWMFDSLSIEQENSFKTFHSKYDTYFRSTRNDLIDRRLKELLLEHSGEGDYIDKIVDFVIQLQC